jgi:hypothetical protein
LGTALLLLKGRIASELGKDTDAGQTDIGAVQEMIKKKTPAKKLP